MRRPNRHIDVFSISALDLFASALGAFILVSIILFPYYLKDQKAAGNLAVETMARERAESDLARETAIRTALEARIAKFQALASKPFLVICMRWAVPGVDIDLHVSDPAGNEFSWFKNNDHGRDYQTSTAELSVDMISGPAIELWQDPSAAAGRYKVEYVANALPAGYTVDVSGSVFDRSGKRDLAPKVLRSTDERVLAAILVVDGDDGSVAIE